MSLNDLVKLKMLITCTRTTVELREFIASQLWPPNLPGLNPVDYSVYRKYFKENCVQNTHY